MKIQDHYTPKPGIAPEIRAAASAMGHLNAGKTRNVSASTRETRRRWMMKLNAERAKRAIAVAIALFFALNCWGLDFERLADAIGKAENSKSHPYGIMQHYAHTTPRAACINTVRHQHTIWQSKRLKSNPGEFLVFLASTYAPVGAANDPNGKNKNWVKNVNFYCKQGKTMLRF
jgi:hypothetical protein